MCNNYWKIAVFCLGLVYAETELNMGEQQMRMVTGKFCGSYLADTLSMLCKGLYNGRQKKEYYYPNFADQNEDYASNEVELDEDQFVKFPFKARKAAKALIPFDFRKRSMGIVDECCHKSCSLWEMKSYCAR